MKHDSIKKQQSFYDSYWRKSSWKRKLAFVNKFHRESALSLLKKNKVDLNNEDNKIVDIGMGNSDLIFKFDKSQIFGYDISQTAILNAQYHANKIGKNPEHFIVGHPADKKAFFDGVFLIHILEHVENPKSFIDTINMVMKPGSKLVVLIPINEPKTKVFREIKQGYYNELHKTKFSKDSVIKMLEEHFEILDYYENNFLFEVINKAVKNNVPMYIALSYLMNLLSLIPFRLVKMLDEWLGKTGKFKPQQIGVLVLKS
ncbi:MAG TPA: methyltransferase domain-containing protein [bacterium]|nr:methyltransferase domain-containing protein [bacterium]